MHVIALWRRLFLFLCGAGPGYRDWWEHCSHQPRPRAHGAGGPPARAPLRAQGQASTATGPGYRRGQRHQHGHRYGHGAGRRHRGTNTTGADRARAPGAPPGTTPPAQRRRRGADRAGGMGPRGTPIAPNSCNVRGKPTAAAGFQTRASKGRQTGSKKQGREGVSNTEKKKKFHHIKKSLFVPALSPLCPRFVPVSQSA